MRSTQHRPIHHPRSALPTRLPTPDSRLPQSDPRSPIPGPRAAGFTLIELIIVVLVILILATLTVAVVGNMLDNDRVRGASRQIQNYLAGARDRAIYSASRQEGGTIPPRVGVRFLSDPSLIVPHPVTGEDVYRGFNSMVFVQEVDPMPTSLRVWLDTAPGSPTFGQWLASQCRNFDDNPKLTLPEDDGPDGDGQFEPIDPLNSIRGVQSLGQRGLLESRIERLPDASLARFYYVEVNFDDFLTGQTFYVRFRSDSTVDQVDPATGCLLEGTLSRAFDSTKKEGGIAKCHFRLLPAPMPNEEPRLLPEGVVIDIQSSVVGGAPQSGVAVPTDVTLQNLARADGSFDIMFNAQGIVDGPIAASGLVHLVVAGLEDLERGYFLSTTFDPDPAVDGDEYIIPGNAFVDSDGDGNFDDSDADGNPDERLHDVQIVSIRTQTGSVYSSDINPAIDSDSASGTFGRLIDPYSFAETGGEAK